MNLFSKIVGLVSNPLSVLEDRVTNRNTFNVVVTLVTFYAIMATAAGTLGVFLSDSVAIKVMSGLLAIDGVIILRGLLVNPPKLVMDLEDDEDLSEEETGEDLDGDGDTDDQEPRDRDGNGHLL